MGVHGLWQVLGPVANKCTIEELQGKTLAIDLSTWIYESHTPKSIKGKSALTPHIRVLFWRVYHLLLNQIKPVFVLEGTPHVLKKAELQRRQKNVNRSLQDCRDEFPSHDRRRQDNVNRSLEGFGNELPSPHRPSTSGDSLGSSNFMKKVTECRTLLDIFGIPYLEAKGEAEATCAALNQHNVVDGCVTNDNDAFLFGAKVVYRNFSCNEKKVDKVICEYKMDDIESKLSLTRERLVAYALLSGCDYTKGAPHVGREKVLKFLNATENQDILDRLKSWKDDETWTILSTRKEVKKPKHCYRCAHIGSMEVHVKSGCVCCDTDVSCNYRDTALCTCTWHRNSRLYEEKKDEFLLRNRALQLPDFPDQEIIDIFLKNPLPDKKLIENIKWTKADWKQVECFCQRMFPKNFTNIVLNLMPVLISVENSSLSRMPMELSNSTDELSDSVLSVIPEISGKTVEEETDKKDKETNKKVVNRKGRKRKNKLPSLEELAKQPRIDEIFHKKKINRRSTIDQFFIKKTATSQSEKTSTVKQDTNTSLDIKQEKKTNNLPTKQQIFIDITELSEDEDQQGSSLRKENNVRFAGKSVATMATPQSVLNHSITPVKSIDCMFKPEPFVDHDIVPAKSTDRLMKPEPTVADTSSIVPAKQQTYTDTLDVSKKENVNLNFLTKQNSTFVNTPAKKKKVPTATLR